MKGNRGSLTIVNQLTLGLFEGVMTIFGLIVLVFPLALWAVPQHGPFANTVFYIVLSTGCGSLIGLISLAYLKGFLFPVQVPQGTPKGGKARLQAYITWDQSQADARKVEQQLRTIKGSALHNLGYMARIASLIGTIVALLYLSTWAFMHLYHGSTEVLSAEARYQLLHPDNWNWK